MADAQAMADRAPRSDPLLRAQLAADARPFRRVGSPSPTIQRNDDPAAPTRSSATEGRSGLLGTMLGWAEGAMAAWSSSGPSSATAVRSPAAPAAPAAPDPTIPDLMHFVWLGGRLPDDRRENVKAWKQATGVRVVLWLDDNSAAAMGASAGELADAGVEFRTLASLKSDRLQRLRRDLPTVREGRVQGPSAAAVSDVARLEILKAEGGHYMDSDNKPGPEAAAFRGMAAPRGLRLGWGKMGDPSQSLDEGFSNDAMSAVPGHAYVADYLDASYGALEAAYPAPPDAPARSYKDVVRAPRNPAELKDAVMGSTGPNRMKDIPLPGVSGASFGRRAAEVGLGDADPATIAHFKQLRESVATTPEAKRKFEPRDFPEEAREQFGAIGYDSKLFARFVGGSWHGENR